MPTPVMDNDAGFAKLMETLKSKGFATAQVRDGRVFLLSRGTVEKLVEALKSGEEYVSLFIADSPEALKAHEVQDTKTMRA